VSGANDTESSTTRHPAGDNAGDRRGHRSRHRAGNLTGYFATSQTWWASLVFLLPWVIIYEVGTWYYTFDPATQTEQRIVAFSLFRNALASLGATAYWVAPAAVVSVLLGLSWLHKEHSAENKPDHKADRKSEHNAEPKTNVRRRVTIRTLAGMGIESLLWAGPLMLMGLALARVPLGNQAGVASVHEHLGEAIVLSIGAGIYEELVFRLMAMTALHFFLVDFLLIRSRWVTPVAIVMCALLFSVYHYWGPEHFTTQTFVFRTLAGIYFGGLLVTRGFGITAGTHALYDVCIVLLRAA